jgi:GMP synthase-like glutamine amidotransferase
MKPVLIVQHLSSDGPAFLGSWLRRQGLPYEVRNWHAGQSLPNDMRDFAALAVLGGEMSANDPLPALRQTEALILDAMRRGCPVVGHCLGGQLMARALGAGVGPSPQPEIGWSEMTVGDHATALHWFGRSGPQRIFQWHEESFELPPGAVRLAGSAACPNQAFAFGPHLAMQFHVELDEDKLLGWTQSESPDWVELQQRHVSVMGAAAMRAGAAAGLPAQQQLAEHVYSRWLGACVDGAAGRQRSIRQ